MNILLTGATGYIGSHTAVALACIAGGKLDVKSFNIVLLDNLCNSDLAVVDRIQEIIRVKPNPVKNTSITFIQGDIRDTSLLTQVLHDHQIDSVIHFAGLKAVGESVNNVKVPLQFVNRRAGDIATCYADTNKAFSTLNWVATRSLADMCQSAWLFEQSSTKK